MMFIVNSIIEGECGVKIFACLKLMIIPGVCPIPRSGLKRDVHRAFLGLSLVQVHLKKKKKKKE